MKTPLKPGDRIVAYYRESPHRLTGRVIAIKKNIVDFELDHSGAVFGAHIKQCRRLAPKKEGIYVTREDLRKAFWEAKCLADGIENHVGLLERLCKGLGLEEKG